MYEFGEVAFGVNSWTGAVVGTSIILDRCIAPAAATRARNGMG